MTNTFVDIDCITSTHVTTSTLMSTSIVSLHKEKQGHRGNSCIKKNYQQSLFFSKQLFCFSPFGHYESCIYVFLLALIYRKQEPRFQPTSTKPTPNTLCLIFPWLQFAIITLFSLAQICSVSS